MVLESHVKDSQLVRGARTNLDRMEREPFSRQINHLAFQSQTGSLQADRPVLCWLIDPVYGVS